MADALSCLMVAGSEELLSRVIRVEVQEGAGLRFPVAVVVPFCSRYRGNYRDVAVKVVDREGRSSYVTPVTTEGTCGGQRVKNSAPEFTAGPNLPTQRFVCLLTGLVCGGEGVLPGPVRRHFPSKSGNLHRSCQRSVAQTLHGPPSLSELPPRILHGSSGGANRGTVVVMRTVSPPVQPAASVTHICSHPPQVQPLDAALLAAVKARSDAYRPVVSTSPVLHLTHPSCQRLRRPLTLSLPCPPNPDRKRQTWGRGEAPPACDRPAAFPRR